MSAAAPISCAQGDRVMGYKKVAWGSSLRTCRTVPIERGRALIGWTDTPKATHENFCSLQRFMKIPGGKNEENEAFISLVACGII